MTAGERDPDPWPPAPPRYRLSRRQAWFADPRTDAFGAIRPGAHLAAIQARIAWESAPLAAPAPPAGPADGQAGAGGSAGDTGTGEPGPVDTSGTADLPSATGPQWNPLGPAGVGLGQGDLRPRVSGRVVSIAVHTGGQRAYAGTANGGTWYTEDAGLHWRCLDTYAETAPLTGRALGNADALAVGAVAVEWGADASADVVYVGTGEASRSVDSFFGIGIRVATGPAAASPLDPTVSPWHLEAPDLVNKAIYRMAADPTRPGVVYAATTVGLWRRAGNAAADPTVWTKVFDPTPSGGCTWLDWLTGSSSQAGPVLVETDVVIAPTAGASPQTIYVAVQDVTTGTSQQVWQSQSGDSGSWTAVPGYTSTDRIALAVAPSDPSVVYALSRGTEPPPAPPPAGPPPAVAPPPPPVPTNAARLQAGTFQPIANMPTNLAGEIGHSQSYYDTVVSVDPLAADVIWMGGSAMQVSTAADWNAALFRGQVTAGAAAGTWTFGFLPASNTAPATDPSWVGAGAHPDVHAIEFSGPAATATVWLGCDGGIFQCAVVTPPPASGARGVARNTAVGPWQALNDGLAITQPNYLAQTPVSDSLMLAGTQDNGTEQRLGPAAWKVIQEGDGGGCAIDPGHPNRRLVQYTGFTWYTETDPTRYYVQTLNYSSTPALKTAWQAENHDSAFYSHAAARVLGSGVTALVFGSYRLWYCEDWGQHWIPRAPAPDSWQTLPTGSNPLEATDAAGQPAPNMNQDSLASQVIRVAFIDDNRLLVLTQAGFSKPNPRPAALYLFTRSGPPWTTAWLSPPDPSQPAPAAPPAGAQNGLPAGEIPVGLAMDTPGPPATCYVTLGVGQDPKHPRIDHVWWYDGAHWWPCRFDATVADTPVNAAVVDVDRTVYVGTDVGVWKGVPNTAATPPTWAWSQFSHGLPEVPVVDLVLSPSPHLLRAATHGRGVWELNLDETGPVNQTYLRAHSADTRRLTFPAGGNDPNTPTDPPPLARIDASPDIIITGPANPAAPADLPLFKQSRPKYSDSTRVLQYALRRRQLAAAAPPPTAATVVVDGYFGTRTKNAVIAVQAATPGLTADGVVNAASWQAIVTAPYVDALAGADAGYLDMALLDRISPVAGTAGGPSLASLPSNAEVYVQVNARGWPRRPAGTVHVGLLATPAVDATLAGLPALPGDWVAQFQAAVTTAPGIWVTGGAPWAWIGSPATMATTRPLHPEEPQVVRFVVTFPLPSGAPSMPANWTLLAFADDPLDPLSSAVTSVLGLITNDRHAAVRSVTLAIP